MGTLVHAIFIETDLRHQQSKLKLFDIQLKKKLYLNLFLILPFLNCNVLAQEYITKVKSFGQEQGLSHREVFSIHQDKKGFIWLATKFGLNRFDGHTFQWWTKEKDGLSHDEMHHILEDANGFLWVFTMANWYNSTLPKHISLVNINTGKVYTLEERFGISCPFHTKDIISFKANKRGRVVFTTKQGKLHSLTPAGQFKTTELPFPGVIQLEHIGPNGDIWASVGPELDQVEQLVKLGQDGTVLQSIDFSQPQFWLEMLSVKGNDSLLYTTFHEDHPPVIHTTTRARQRQTLEDSAFRQELKAIYPFWDKKIFYQGDKDFFWFKGDTLLHVLHPEKGKIIDIDRAAPQIRQSNIHTVFFDREGIAWLGTANGLFMVDLQPNQFTRYLYKKDYELEERYSCRGIWADSTQLFINTYKGRIKINRKEESATLLPYIPHLNHKGRETLLGFFPLALEKGKDKSLWIGESSLINRNIQSKREEVLSWDRGYSDEIKIWSIYEGKANKVWIGTDHGLAFLDTSRNALRFDSIANHYGELGQSHIYAFTKSAWGHIWLATTTGLYAWQEDFGILKRWWPGAKEDNYIPYEAINHVHEDEEGIVWLASGGGGLIRLEPKLGREPRPLDTVQLYRQFTVVDGLSNNNLYAVYEDEEDRLWISSDLGIIQFDKEHSNAKAFLPRDGITHKEFNRISHYQAADGSLYFGSLNGVTAFHPKQFPKTANPHDTPLQIIDFQQFDNKLGQLVNRTDQLQKTNTIRLRAGDRLFRLAFALLDYRHQEQIRYAWKLEGLDKEWNHIRENFIRISGLAPGHYTLKIKGQTINGQWSDKELHLKVIVLSPFYTHTLFLSFSLLLLFAIVYFMFKWRTHTLKSQQLKLDKLVKQRTKTIEEQREKLLELDKSKNNFFANISHELRTPLSLMIGPIDSALKRLDPNDQTQDFLKLARQSGHKLLQFVNEILDLSKMDAGKLQLKEDNTLLHPFLHRLLSQFEAPIQQKDLTVSFNYQADAQLHIQLDQQKFEVIFNNLVFNALKFSPTGGEINISLVDKGQVLRLEVMDSGPGIHPKDLPYIFDRFYQSKYGATGMQGGTGIGLALCKEYAALFGGSINAENSPNQGAWLYFEFPKKVVAVISNGELNPVDTILEPVELKTILPPRHQDKSLSILVVEDNLDLQMYIQLLLKKHYKVSTVNNGQAALDWLAKMDSKDHPPSLIISDVMMPVMDGLQFLDVLKTTDKWRHIPIILLTARASLPDKLKAFRIGVDDYILKPFEEEELIARVENVLRNSLARNKAGDRESVGQDEKAIVLSEADAIWLNEQEKLLKKEFINPNFTATQWAAQVALSERHLQRKLKLLTGMSPYKYLSEIRLTEARQMLETGTHHTIAEVAYSVGFSNPKSFTRSFRKRFGKVPSDYF